MSEEQRKEFIKYAASNGGMSIFFIVAVFMFAIACAVFSCCGFGSLIGNIYCIVCAIILWVIFPWCKNKGINEMNKRLNELEQQGKLSYLYADFEHGSRAFNDRLRMGENFLIGNKTGTVVTFGEITRIYKYVHSTNGIKDNQIMKIVTVNNTTRDLCNLSTWFSDENEEMQVVQYVLSKNPNVRVGYKT